MDEIKSYMSNLWYQKTDDVYTIGISEEAVAEFDEVLTFDLPTENDQVTEDEVCGSIETSDGPIDIYAPVSGTILEVNTAIIEDPQTLIDDPQGEGWIIKIASEEELEDDDEDEDEDDDFEDDEDEDLDED